MNCLDLLTRRRSTPSRLLGEPGPTPEQLNTLLSAAIRVPDHGKLTPWRFLRIQGTARLALGELLAQLSRERDPNATGTQLAKERGRFANAPTIIAVISRLTPGHKVPECEQLLSGGAVCFSLLLGAQALGFGAQWLTGWAAYDPAIHRQLGIGEHERILGFIHLGTAREAPPERPPAGLSGLLSGWTP